MRRQGQALIASTRLGSMGGPSSLNMLFPPPSGQLGLRCLLRPLLLPKALNSTGSYHWDWTQRQPSESQHELYYHLRPHAYRRMVANAKINCRRRRTWCGFGIGRTNGRGRRRSGNSQPATSSLEVPKTTRGSCTVSRRPTVLL